MFTFDYLGCIGSYLRWLVSLVCLCVCVWYYIHIIYLSLLNAGISWGLCWSSFAPEGICISFFQVPNGSFTSEYLKWICNCRFSESPSFVWVQTYIKGIFQWIFPKQTFFFPLFFYLHSASSLKTGGTAEPEMLGKLPAQCHVRGTIPVQLVSLGRSTLSPDPLPIWEQKKRLRVMGGNTTSVHAWSISCVCTT